MTRLEDEENEIKVRAFKQNKRVTELVRKPMVVSIGKWGRANARGILDPGSGAQIISQDFVTKNNIKLKRLPRADSAIVLWRW